MRALFRFAAAPFSLRRIALGLVALGLVLTSSAADAQSDLRSLRAQMELLQQELLTMHGQLSDLEGVVYGGAAPTRQAPASAGSDRLSQRLAVLETRFDQLDEWRRQVSGRFDEVANLISRVDSRIERLVADVDFRLSGLEEADRRSAAQTASGQITNQPVGSGAAGGTVLTDTSAGYKPSGEPRPLGTIRVDDAGQATGGTQQQLARAAPTSATPEVQYEFAYDLMRQTRYDEAEIAFNNFVEDKIGRAHV